MLQKNAVKKCGILVSKMSVEYREGKTFSPEVVGLMFLTPLRLIHFLKIKMLNR